MEYKVTDEELRQIPGCTPLKIYIVLNNSPNGATAAMLANQLQCPRSSLFYGLSQVQKLGLLSKNGDIYSNILDKSPRFGKEKEKKQKKKENPTGNISTTTTLNKEQFVNLIFSWFLADADYMKRLCDLFEIAGAEVGDLQKMKEGLTPYVISFARLLRMHKTDLEKKGAEDTKSHFFNWMQAGNYQRIARALERAAEKKEREAVHTPSPQAVPSPYLRGRVAQAQQLTEEQQAEQMLQKRRRMEKAEEQQRHLDEIQREADGSTDTTARDRIFARLGLK